MKSNHIQTWILCFVIAFVGLAACADQAATQQIFPTHAGVQSMPSAAATPASESTSGVRDLSPQHVALTSADGTPIAGTFWPPVAPPAVGVVLMHMMGGSKSDWQQVAVLLQGATITSIGEPSQPVRRFAVLAIDFRGHGESGGSRDQHARMVDDARAALAFMRSHQEVDAQRIFLVGASIGADAAVDACEESCIGAISLSPGGFLGIDYAVGLKRLGDKPVLCVASEGDTQSANTCRNGESLGLSDYQVQIYQGNAHGTNMLAISDQPPFLIDLMFKWLEGHMPG